MPIVSSDVSTFAPDATPKQARVCAQTGRPFAVGDKVYSILYEESGEIKRRDLSASAWRATPRPANALAWWSSRVRSESEKDKKAKLAPNDALIAFFESLADKPEKAPLRYALALLLARRRVFRFEFDDSKNDEQDPQETLFVYSQRDETGYVVPVVRMTEEQIAEVQAQLVELVDSPSAALDAESKVEPTRKNAPSDASSNESTPPSVDAQRRLQATFAAFDSEELEQFAEEAARGFEQ